MERAIVKSLCGVFRNPMAALAIVLLAAIIFVSAPQTRAKAVQQRPYSTAANSAGNSTRAAEQSDEWQTVRMRVTAYCPCEECCGEYSDGVTACGHKIQPGDVFVAADRKYAFGTEMIVAGYSNSEPVKVLDRGGAIRENRLDVFFHSHQEALNWGVKYLDVKVRRGSA